MLMEEWQDRYYSFNHAWNTTLQQRMASMRNGLATSGSWLSAPHHISSRVGRNRISLMSTSSG